MSVRRWIERVYADVPGALVVCHEDAAGRFHGTGGQCGTHAEAADRVAALDADGARGVYLRVTTVARRLGPHERGGAADSHHLPGLWGDVDYGTTGHRFDPARHEGRTLPPDESEARRIVDTSGLPAPSLWVHSGGGLYPWWLLDTPAQVTAENRAELESLSTRWQSTIQASAHRLGYEYGAGVGDLARVLRVPGTTNRKDGQERPCRVVEDTGQVYALTELLAAVPAHFDPEVHPDPEVRTDGGVWESVSTSDSVLDRYADQHTWAQVLGRYGFTPCPARHGAAIAECFTRPGNPEHSCSAHTLRVNPHVLVVWSESAGLPTGKGQRLTKARVVAHMEYSGDVKALARSLTDTRDTDVVPADDAGATVDYADGGQPDRVPGATWQAQDLADTIAGLIAGTLTRPAPTVGEVADGAALFYPARVNGIHGDSNAGKTWTALTTCAQEVAAGRVAVYIDLEDDAAGVVARLLDMGAKPADVLARFVYINPGDRLDTVGRGLLAQMLTKRAPSVVVIDSTGEGLSLDGANPNADEEVARWFRSLPRFVANYGAAVIVLDHMAKADDGALWPIGSQRKRAAINGAQYVQRVLRPFSRDTAGAAVLVCAKDRGGNYRAGQKVAELAVTPQKAGGLSVALVAPDPAATTAGETFRPTGYMERVSRALEAQPESVSLRGVQGLVPGKQAYVRQALAVLVAEGYVTRTSVGNRHLHSSARPFREADQTRDTLDPESVPEGGSSVSVSLEGDTGHTLPAVSGTQSGHGRDTAEDRLSYPTSPTSPDLARANGRTPAQDLAPSPIRRGRGRSDDPGQHHTSPPGEVDDQQDPTCVVCDGTGDKAGIGELHRMCPPCELAYTGATTAHPRQPRKDAG